MEIKRTFYKLSLRPLRRCLKDIIFTVCLVALVLTGICNLYWYSTSRNYLEPSGAMRALYRTEYDDWSQPWEPARSFGDTGTGLDEDIYNEDGVEDYDGDYQDAEVYDSEEPLESETTTLTVMEMPARNFRKSNLLGNTVTKLRGKEYDGTQTPTQLHSPLVEDTAVKSMTSQKRIGQSDNAVSNETGPKNEQMTSNQTLKTILFWNPLFHSETYRFGLGQAPFIVNKCRVNTCRTVKDHTVLGKADLVMFHGPKIPGFPLPQRLPGQIYAYLQLEPHVYLSNSHMPAYQGTMNWTIAHRQDADIWLPYGRVNRNPKPSVRPTLDPASQPRSIAWAVSHCNTTGRREMYVRELMKHIDVDVYGKCGPLKCSKDRKLGCYKMFQRKYRFVMALENNHCVDYATEKLYRALLFDIVPIVYGGANYSQLAPPHSVIDIEDFPRPEDLARYLRRLAASPAEYNAYFAWKQRYRIERRREKLMAKMFCSLCERLHNPRVPMKVYGDLKAWWLNGTCQNRVVHAMKRKNKW